MSIDEVACKLDAVQVQPKVARNLALSIKAAVREKVGAYLLCSVGVAANKLPAKLACDMEKPDGLTILRPEETECRPSPEVARHPWHRFKHVEAMEERNQQVLNLHRQRSYSKRFVVISLVA